MRRTSSILVLPLVLTGVLAASARAAVPQSLCGKRMDARLEVLQQVETETEEDYRLLGSQTLLLGKNNSVVLAGFGSAIGASESGLLIPYSASVFCGRVTGPSLAGLNAAMAALPIATQGDCRVERPTGTRVEIRVRWRGQGREHAFRISSVNGDLPACQAQVEVFLNQLGTVAAVARFTEGVGTTFDSPVE